MKSAVIIFPGSNCDKDTYEACRFFNWKVSYIWHNETNIQDYDIIFLPGGFSYGDYIASGRLAKFSPVMKSVKEFILQKKGMVVGICNGFQILCEAGILPGALGLNINNRFICDDVCLDFYGAQIKLPIAHKEGRYIKPDKTNIKDLIFLKYKTNPNGSDENIAGIYDKNKRVMALMPHPERAVFNETGNTNGRIIFEFIQKEFLYG